MKINIDIPDNMVKAIDNKCEKEFFSRSEWIRTALRDKLFGSVVMESGPLRSEIPSGFPIKSGTMPVEKTYDELWEDWNYMPVKKERLEAGYCATFHTAGEKRPLYDVTKVRADGTTEFRKKLCKECVVREVELAKTSGGHLE